MQQILTKDPRTAAQQKGYRHPNFLFIGPDKSGSTWLYQTLRLHSQVFLPSVKELFFFDRFYAKGWNWYGSYFKGAGERHRIVGEICHDYLFSLLACERIARDLPHVKLMVCLREPAQRAFSQYLYMLKVGLLDCDFESALQSENELIEHSCYLRYLSGYFQRFRRDQIYVAIFEDLVTDPQRFFDGICNFLNVERVILPNQLQEKVLPAGKPKLRRVAKLARGVGWNIRRLGFPGIVGRVKDLPLLARLLYSSNGTNGMHSMSLGAQAYLRKIFTPEVQRLDELLATNLSARWGYSKAAWHD